MGDFEDRKAAIESDFPGWQVWRSDAGRWYATRSTDLTDAQLQAGYAMTVAADDAAGLRELLLDQKRGEG
ncbi:MULTISPECIES: hypothetical protein [Actinomadura]|uniref:Uncharacterized protein n=1 Tax=Actinomadura litoris TaxID=2678616 RepID=A0A7K1LE12_9ACTN|nr:MULTISPECIES: hypothetical protein [Actinomadura]MBT2208320.1 hypothetical protein [Actinomadura sp. NEAU-AAG7]MUN42415.1 hypothetical protein [Actinomadura litoris]